MNMKKLCVDETKCIGCGACVAVDGEHFDFNDSGLSSAKSQDNLLDAEGKVATSIQEAIDSCPVGAIDVKEVAEESGDNA
jgi:ferredoxin